MMNEMCLETAPVTKTFGADIALEFQRTVMVFVLNEFLLINGDVTTNSALQKFLFEYSQHNKNLKFGMKVKNRIERMKISQ